MPPPNTTKKSNYGILQKLLHAIHLLKLLNKMCEYEMDVAGIVEIIQWTQFCPQITNRRTEWHPISTSLKLGYNKCWVEATIDLWTQSMRFSTDISIMIAWDPFQSKYIHHKEMDLKYRQFSNIRCTNSPNLIVSRLILQLSLCNPLKPGVKLRMKM